MRLLDSDEALPQLKIFLDWLHQHAHAAIHLAFTFSKAAFLL